MFAVEMTELFGGTQLDYVLNKLTYKEAIGYRDAFIKKKKKEDEFLEKERKKEMETQQRLAARNQILGRK